MKETSAGAVIFREISDGVVFLLLHYPSGHWDFVKGKIEKNENPLQTVIRESKEETGISDLDFIEGFEESINYNFQFKDELVHKKVIFYLAETNTEKVTLSHEHLDFIWLDYKNALEKITYQNSKSVLSKAFQLLSK
ncbi:MAG TPA: bis(5'-nucleosyl)-tetraphosphatase [Nitrosopumilaceae archaeon]|nr:bis(5'-nucleosyl)-tetraphosphatase [Nitrosopumilaceae archaeon]